MKTLHDLPFPMTDGALSSIPPEELVEAMINHACTYCSLYQPLANTPCWVFTELGIGMDHSNGFVLIDPPSRSNGMQYRSTPLTIQQAFRLIRMYHARHAGGMS